MKYLLRTASAAAAVLAVTVTAGSTLAADLNARVYKAPPPPAPVAPVANWTGLYVGAGFGYGMWDLDTSSSFPLFGPTSVSNNGGRGWVGQVVAGYDVQFPLANFNLVAGVFGDYDFGHISGTMDTGLAFGPSSPVTGVEKERSYWAVGGRIGWLVTPQILTYWNGGYTQARFDSINFGTLAPGLPPAGLPANTYHGWFMGGGVETQVASIPGLFFNTEYRYSSYDSATLSWSGGPAIGFTSQLKPHVQTVMSGLRYKFNWTR